MARQSVKKDDFRNKFCLWDRFNIFPIFLQENVNQI